MAGARKKPAKKKMVRGPKRATMSERKGTYSSGDTFHRATADNFFGERKGRQYRALGARSDTRAGRVETRSHDYARKHGWTEKERRRFTELQKDKDEHPGRWEGKVSPKEQVMRASITRSHKSSAAKKAARAKKVASAKKAAPKRSAAKKRAAPLKRRSYR